MNDRLEATNNGQQQSGRRHCACRGARGATSGTRRGRVNLHAGRWGGMDLGSGCSRMPFGHDNGGGPIVHPAGACPGLREDGETDQSRVLLRMLVEGVRQFRVGHPLQGTGRRYRADEEGGGDIRALFSFS
jgi:hypothetical protein